MSSTGTAKQGPLRERTGPTIPTIEFPKDLFQETPPPSEFTGFIKTPFAERVNPLIHGEDPEFLRILEYFHTLLRRTTFTINEILENIFEPDEIRLIEPTLRPAELVKRHRDNATRFRRILETRFTGHPSSLHLKMAFLYFGLPIEPMKPGGFEWDVPMGLGQDGPVETDPLMFLDNYAENTPLAQYFSSSLDLRGGASEVNPSGELEEEETVAEEVVVWGYQGNIRCIGKYSDIVQAADLLLGAKNGLDYNVCLEVWNQQDLTAAVTRVTATLYHNETPPEGDPIVSLLPQYFSDDTETGKHHLFVHYDKETHPGQLHPDYSGQRIIRLWDSTEKNAYMRAQNIVPTRMPNEFRTQYVRAMRVLFPDPSHYLISFPGTEGTTYGLLDPVPHVWDQFYYPEPDEEWILAIEPTSLHDRPDEVVIWVPGYSGEGPINADGAHFTKSNIEITNTERDEESMAKLVVCVQSVHPTIFIDRDDVSFQVWMSAHGFLDPKIRGAHLNMDDVNAWRAALREYRYPRVHSGFNNLNIAVRPIYREYQINSEDKAQSFKANINSISLEDFKALVRSDLYPDYADGQVLYIAQSFWAEDMTEFSITSKTSADDWIGIVRRITEPEITVTINDSYAPWGKFRSRALEWRILANLVKSSRYRIGMGPAVRDARSSGGHSFDKTRGTRREEEIYQARRVERFHK